MISRWFFRALTLVVTVLAALTMALGWSGTALAATTTDAAQAIRSGDPVFFDPDFGDPDMGEDVADSLRDQIQGSGQPIYIAILAIDSDPDRAIQTFAQGAGAPDRRGVYVLLTEESLRAGSTPGLLPQRRAGELAAAAVDNSGGNKAVALEELVDNLINEMTGAGTGGNNTPQDATSGAADEGGGGFGGVFLLALAGAGLFLITRGRRRRSAAGDDTQDGDEFGEIRAAADEDVTLLGEDIAKLDLDVDDPKISEQTRQDYITALDSYDKAKAALARARSSEDLAGVSEALENGRYAMLATRARLAGQEPPPRRAPCFFNPAHGPSVTDVGWEPPAGEERKVPVCAADAERVLRGQEPQSREVLVHGQRMPYWQAGPQWGPYAGGYYGGFGGMGTGLLGGMLIGSMLTPGFGLGGFGGNTYVENNYGDGFGGGDFGGGDFGGGDFGGGDFGGGDF